MLPEVGSARVSTDFEEDKAEFVVSLILYLVEHQERDRSSDNCFVELVEWTWSFTLLFISNHFASWRHSLSIC